MIAGLFCAYNLDHRKLAKPDEGRYAEIARNMANSGDYVTPRLNGIKYFYKPPLQYWATAIAFEAFGRNEWTARLWVSLCGLLATLLVAYTAMRYWGTEAGCIAGLVALGSPYFAALAQINTLDMGVTAFTTMTLCGYLLADIAGKRGAPKSGWLLMAWAGAALAVLSKGLIGIVFPAAALCAYALMHFDFHRLKRAGWLTGVPVFLVIAAPWFVLVSMANPEFARFFFIHEHFERFLTPVSRREAPAWYFLPILAAGLIPWTLLLLPAAKDAWVEEPRASGFRPLRFLWLWVGFIVIFFSASTSKLPAYILPAFPAIALLLTAAIVRRDPRALSHWLVPMVLVAAVGVVATLFMADRRRADAVTLELYRQFEPWLTAMASLLLVAIVIGIVALRRNQRLLGIGIAALGTLIAVQLGVRGYEVLSPLQSAHAVATAMRPHVKPTTQLYSVDMYDQPLPFYLNRDFVLVDYVDEFEIGLRAEPQRALPTVEAFLASWGSAKDAMAIMQPGLYEELTKRDVPMQLVFRDPRRVAVKKPIP